MSRASDRLREFHEAFEVEAAPGIAGRRARLHYEEHFELQSALEAHEHATDLEAIARELADVMVIAYGTADLLGIDLDAAFEAVMDANMAKLPPCALCHGKGSNPHELLIGRPSADCSACGGTGKGKPIKRDDGKIEKPPGWQPPDMSRAIVDEREAFRREVRRLLTTREAIPFKRLQEIANGPGVAAVHFEHSWALEVPAARLTGVDFHDGRAIVCVRPSA